MTKERGQHQFLTSTTWLRTTPSATPLLAITIMTDSSIGNSASTDVSGDAEPLALPTRPDVGVTPHSRETIRFLIGRPCVDDCDIAHDPDVHVVGLKIRNHRPSRNLCQESRAVDQRAVGISVQKVIRQYLIKPAHVRQLYPADEGFIQPPQGVTIE